MKKTGLIFIPLLLTLISTFGCSLTSRKALQSADRTPLTSSEDTPEALPPLVQENQIFESEKSEEQLSLLQEESLREITKSIHSIPVEINKDVKRWIEYFSKKDRERFQRFLNRGAQYREVVENVLRKNGLPAELYYLAMIESGYQNHATSHASAVGVWQFIRGTGTRYGLEINSHVDERRDPIRATEAAVRYLRDLHNVFGSWHLAMAGYNAGEYRVVRAVFNGKTRDFWKLVKLKALPAETRDYIPKFLAAVEIGQNPGKYGFQIQNGEKYPDLQAIHLPGSVALEDIASTSGIPSQDLKRVNPHLRQSITPPGKEGYDVWVPLAFVAKVERSKNRIVRKTRPDHSRSLAQAPPKTSNSHRVRKGENLSLIARRYGMSLAELKHLNNLRSNRIYVGAQLKVKSSSLAIYQVRRGDSLSGVAAKHGMTLNQLKQLNRLSSNTIYPGKELRVYGAKVKVTNYRVREGDNLSKIAQRFGISVKNLKQINSMKNSVIQPGQILLVKM